MGHPWKAPMTVKLTASWEIKNCDVCSAANETDDDFPAGWSVLVTSDGETLAHRVVCPKCSLPPDALLALTP